MSLRAEVERLLHRTGWAENSQRKWLIKHGCDSWGSAPQAVLQKAKEKLEFCDGAIDTSVAFVQNEERVDLRVYEGDEE